MKKAKRQKIDARKAKKKEQFDSVIKWRVEVPPSMHTMLLTGK